MENLIDIIFPFDNLGEREKAREGGVITELSVITRSGEVAVLPDYAW